MYLKCFLIFFVMLLTSFAKNDKMNVLFIMIDDLNDWVGVIGGNNQVKTPNLDALAKKGICFKNAYSVSPFCGPSRTAMLYGISPEKSGSYGHKAANNPLKMPIFEDTISIPKKFQNAGYYVAGVGKIFHKLFNDTRNFDDYQTFKPSPMKGGNRKHIVFGPSSKDDEGQQDMKSSRWIIEKMNEKRDKPFFLALGFHKPHMPWVAPKKYFEQYPLEDIVLPEVLDTDLDDIPRIGKILALEGVGFKGKNDHEYMTAKQDRWKNAVRAYLATITFVDHCVGEVMKALEKSPHADNTIVVVCGDHGWHLGEKHHWRKHALWEKSTKTPLFIIDPRKKDKGICTRIVSLQDVYPTLIELCNLPKHEIDGRSLAPLLNDKVKKWDHPALMIFGPGNFAVRDEQFRYIRYVDNTEELYNHENDSKEHINLANDPKYSKIKENLGKFIPKEWKKDAGKTFSRLEKEE